MAVMAMDCQTFPNDWMVFGGGEEEIKKKGERYLGEVHLCPKPDKRLVLTRQELKGNSKLGIVNPESEAYTEASLSGPGGGGGGKSERKKASELGAHWGGGGGT